MNSHTATYKDLGDAVVCKCSCLTPNSPRFSHRWEAEDWHNTHLATVARARASLVNRKPSVKTQYEYFREMQHDANTPDNLREGWKRLADELQLRIDSPGLSEQGELFHMEPKKRSGSDTT